MFKPLVEAPAEKRYLRAGSIKLALKSFASLSFAAFLMTIFVSLWRLNSHDLPSDYLPDLWRTRVGYPPLPDMVPVEPGELQLPENKDEQPRTLTVDDGFEMGRYEVSFLEYDMFVMDTSRREADEKTGELAFPANESWGRGDRPVINVSWHDAVAYTQWLSEQRGQECRLPTGSSGSMPPAPEPQRSMAYQHRMAATISQIKGWRTVMVAAANGMVEARLPLLGSTRPTNGTCTTCTATFGSGV